MRLWRAVSWQSSSETAWIGRWHTNEHEATKQARRWESLGGTSWLESGEITNLGWALLDHCNDDVEEIERFQHLVEMKSR